MPLDDQLRVAPRPHRRRHLRRLPRPSRSGSSPGGRTAASGPPPSRPSPRPTTAARSCGRAERADMARTDANPPMPEFRDDYVLAEVDADYLSKAVKPKQFIHIDQSECIMCEGCVDICPWKCIHMVKTEAIDEAIGTEQPGEDPERPRRVPHRRRRLHPLRPVRRPLPDRRHHPRQGRATPPPPATRTSARTPTATATACGSDEHADRHAPKEELTWPRPCSPRARAALTELNDVGAGLPGLELDLPARLDLPEGLHATAPATGPT